MDARAAGPDRALVAAASRAPDRCPRCHGAFACGVGGTTPCACSTVALSAALQARLRREFDGCLCLICLRELAATDDGAAEDACGC